MKNCYIILMLVFGFTNNYQACEKKPRFIVKEWENLNSRTLVLYQTHPVRVLQALNTLKKNSEVGQEIEAKRTVPGHFVYQFNIAPEQGAARYMQVHALYSQPKKTLEICAITTLTEPYTLFSMPKFSFNSNDEANNSIIHLSIISQGDGLEKSIIKAIKQ